MGEYLDFNAYSDQKDRGEDFGEAPLSKQEQEQLIGRFDAFLAGLSARQANALPAYRDQLEKRAYEYLFARREEELAHMTYTPIPLHDYDSESIYQIKASLVGIRPPIWRRLAVPSCIDFASFHMVLQDAFDWFNCHLYMFEFGKHYACECLEDPAAFAYEARGNERDASTYYLGQVLEPKMRFTYWYDFGDDWCISLEVEKIIPEDTYPYYPYCIKMVRNAPPEDVGGIGGDEEFCATIADSSDPRREELLEWATGDPKGTFDPEHADIKELNELFSRARIVL